MQVILLVNLGSPDKLAVPSIRLFLRKFLSDRRVVNLPRLLWLPILFGVILPFRARKLLKKYQKIWLNGSSPLVYYTARQQASLQGMLGSDKIVYSAFSYSTPDIYQVLDKIHASYDIEELTVLPLYPQFSSTTTSAVFDQVAKFYSTKKYLPKINFINSFYTHDYYINAIAGMINEHFSKHGKPQRLIFSYHSLPVKVIQDGDSYYEQCIKSSELIAARLNLTKEEYLITFQSRFGGGKWLTPSTASVMESLAKSGITDIAVVCPGFISDCLETLEEIKIMNCDIFIKNGGRKFNYIPCLNDDKRCVELLYHLVSNSLTGNIEADG